MVVSPAAPAPFGPMPPRPLGDPEPLSYLDDPADRGTGALAIQLVAALSTEKMRTEGLMPKILSRGSADAAMYWSAAQIIAHHTANGCNLQPGDLIGTGTLSTDEGNGLGSLLEISQGGKTPIELQTGESRSFLEDGDEVTLVAWCEAEGAVSSRVGECVGRVMPAPALPTSEVVIELELFRRQRRAWRASANFPARLPATGRIRKRAGTWADVPAARATPHIECWQLRRPALASSGPLQNQRTTSGPSASAALFDRVHSPVNLRRSADPRARHESRLSAREWQQLQLQTRRRQRRKRKARPANPGAELQPGGPNSNRPRYAELCRSVWIAAAN